MYRPPARQKTASAILSAAIVGSGAVALGYALSTKASLTDMAPSTLVTVPVQRPEAIKPLPRPTPPTPVRPTLADKAQTSRKKDAPAPVNLRNQATAVFAPVLPPLRQPPPVVAAPIPATGNAGNTGNANRVGPGQGAGGFGNGTGAGGSGDGDGDGIGDAVTRPRQIKGKLHWSDLPPDLRETRRGGELELTYRVNVDGRVSDCRVNRSSGIPSLDAQTCRLITQRFRFRPSQDARGRPVPSYIIEVHGWYQHPEGEPDWRED